MATANKERQSLRIDHVVVRRADEREEKEADAALDALLAAVVRQVRDDEHGGNFNDKQ